jgi:MOSC domain-containing protein YiiM
MTLEAHLSHHLSFDDLSARIAALAPAPRDSGRIALVVARPDVDARLTPARCRLSPEGGVDGDRWAKRVPPIADAQITIMRADVSTVIANGQSPSLSGDNLLVELDLSPANLPLGTRLRVGTAVCEVTSKPHRGCDKFAARFGQAARDITTADAFALMRLRGLYVRVLAEGEVGPGDRIEVIERPRISP